MTDPRSTGRSHGRYGAEFNVSCLCLGCKQRKPLKPMEAEEIWKWLIGCMQKLMEG